jgi:NAD(P)-dependent dehydrogenase (short-subunit alcohol dehydrogenase family)
MNNKILIFGGTGVIGFSIAKKMNEFTPKIRVNCIAPSLTDSKMSQKIVSNETKRKAIESMYPIPKIGQGEDFGDLSSFLLSEKNSWITGQILHIDGVDQN